MTSATPRFGSNRLNTITPLVAEPLETLRKRTSSKWRRYSDDVLPLPVAEMDYPLATPIVEALQSAVTRSDTGYFRSADQLAEAFAGFAKKRFNWNVNPAHVTGTVDIVSTIVEVLRHSVPEGASVVVTSPVYAPFFNLPREADRHTIDVPLLRNSDGSWVFDVERIDAAFAAGAKAMLLCNPHNPVGYVPSHETLAAIAESAERYGATVISDEVHGPLTYSVVTGEGPEFVPFLTVSDAARHVGVTLTSASKSFNIAGLKCALIVRSRDTEPIWQPAVSAVDIHTPSQFGSIANIAAFTHGDEWLDGALAALNSNRFLLADLLAEHLPEVRYRVPDTTYLAWLDFTELGWGDDPAARALDVAKVALSSGPDFGTNGRNHVRLNFACSPETLTKAIKRLAEAKDPDE